MNNPNLLSELRKAAELLGEQPRGIAWGYASIMGQAADEVELMRAALEEIAKLNDHINPGVMIARNALKQK